MIAFVRGQYAMKAPARVVVDVNGVGYELQISLNTYAAIADLAEGKLFTWLHVTENAHTLYGFFSETEKELFLQLISVSGVGASTARIMLSGMKPDEIVKAIVQSNTKLLESIKGIGRKTAERIIVELRDKLAKHELQLAGGEISGLPHNTVEADALEALVALGVNRAMAATAVKKAINGGAQGVEDTIKQALKNL
jgi:Holliday junction DNA helicase RuvA